MPNLTPSDIDLLTRTVIGEANGQPPEGQAGVAYSVINRLNNGGFGKTATQVILAPNAYEPWQTRSRELSSISRDSDAYKRASELVNGVVSGEIPDPTNGATHFLNADIVRQRRGGSLPNWAQGNGMKIGDHTFFNPQNPQSMAFNSENKESSIPDYIGAFLKPANKKQDAQPQPDVPDYVSKFSKDAATTQPAPQATVAQEPNGSRPPIAPPMMTDAERAAEKKSIASTAADNNKSFFQKFDEAINPSTVIPAVAGAMFDSGKNAVVSGWDMFKKGLENPNWLPSVESTKSKNTTLSGKEVPATGIKITDPGAALGAVGGLLGMGLSPLTSVLNPAQDQLEKITGNKEFAEKVMNFVPVGPAAKVANEMRPAVKGVRSIADIVPDHYLPEALSAAERNPNLSLVDISQSARNRADMIKNDALAPKAQQTVMDFVDKRKGELAGDLRSTLEVLGEIPNPYDVVTKIQQRAKETGQNVINPIVKNSNPAEITGIINDIDAELAKATKSGLPLSDYQRKLSDLREELRGTRNDRDEMFSDVKGEQGLHKTGTNLRAEADNLMNSASGAERNLGGKLMPWRNRIVDAIDDTNPGYKEGLSQFRTDKEVAESFDRGLNINKKPGTTSESILEHSPGALEDWVNNPKTHPDAIATAKIGALSWMAQELEGMRSGKRLMDSPKDTVLQGKLEALFGKDTAKEYIDLMRDTHRKAQTAAELGAPNSKTFARGREADASPVRVPGAGNSVPGSLQALALGGAGAAAEAIPLLANFHGWPTAIGLGAAGARAGYSAVKSGYENLRYKSDLARRMAEARALTVPLGQQPDLLQLLRDRHAQISGGNKLQDIAPSSLLSALPR